MKLFALAASLRTESLNRKLLAVAATIAREAGHEVDAVDLRDYLLPSYDADIETASGIPESALRLKEKIISTDGILLASPEYNHSMPGHFKNTFDWLSRVRPMPWAKRKVFFMSASPGLVGGNRSLWALRVPFESCGAFVYPDMFSLSSAAETFLPDGTLKDPKLFDRLKKNVEGFLQFAKALGSNPTQI